MKGFTRATGIAIGLVVLTLLLFRPSSLLCAIAQDYSLIDTLTSDYPTITSGAPFFFTVSLERASFKAVELRETLRPIQVDGSVGKPVINRVVYVPAYDPGNTFKEKAVYGSGEAIAPGSYLLTLSQCSGIVTRSISLRAVPAAISPRTRGTILDPIVYTPIVDAVLDPSSSTSLVISGPTSISRRALGGTSRTLTPDDVIVKPGGTFHYSIETSKVNHRDPADPHQHTLVDFALTPVGSTTPVDSWTQHLLKDQQYDPYSRAAPTLPAGQTLQEYVLTAIRDPVEGHDHVIPSDNRLIVKR